MTDTTEDGIIEFMLKKAGSNNIAARFTSDALKLINSTGLEVGDGLLTLGSTAVTSTAAELNLLDGSTAGTVVASKAVVVDANKDIASFRNVTLTGELDAATLDLSSSADIAGDLVLSGGADGALQFTNAGENSIKIPDNQASALIIEEADNAYITFVTSNGSEAITVAKTTNFSGDIDVDGTTTIDNLVYAGTLSGANPIPKVIYATSGAANEASHTLNNPAIYISVDDPDGGDDTAANGDIWIDLD
jgi:hypothetical protein